MAGQAPAHWVGQEGSLWLAVQHHPSSIHQTLGYVIDDIVKEARILLPRSLPRLIQGELKASLVGLGPELPSPAVKLSHTFRVPVT